MGRAAGGGLAAPPPGVEQQSHAAGEGAGLRPGHRCAGAVAAKGARPVGDGLGILQVKKRPARMGRNPATGAQIKIKASKKVAFRAAKELKEAV